MVDFRNLSLGDRNEFIVEDDIDLFVAEIAEGTQGVRRQRVGGYTKFSIDTKLYAVKVYDELNKILAGQSNLNAMIDGVAEAFRKHMLNGVYDLWANAGAAEFGGDTYFPAAGQFVEANFLTLIDHVEAASGKQATIIAPKAAIRTYLKPGIESDKGDGYRDDLYNLGYAGKYYGTPIVAMPQRHKVGSTQFLYNPNVITVLATEERPLKVNEQLCPAA